MDRWTFIQGCVLFLWLTTGIVSCLNRNKILPTPRPMTNFRLDDILGGWYLVTRINPESFDDTGMWDAKFTYGMQGGRLVRRTIWWKAVCTQVDFTLRETTTPGIFHQKDNMGDMLTGILIYLARTRDYGIVWHCTRFGANNVCTDASVLVESREPNPTAGVWRAIETDLRRIFDLTLPEMFRMPFHIDLPCERGGFPKGK